MAKKLKTELYFDDNDTTIKYGQFKIKVTSPNQLKLCDSLFNVPIGTKIHEDSIDYDRSNSWNYQKAFHAFRPLNKQFEKLTGIRNFIKYKDGYLWISTD